MKSVFKQVKTAVAAAAFMSVAFAANATAIIGAPVTIQESAIAGAAANQKVVNQLSGQYDEVVTFGAGNTFSTEAIFNAGAWFGAGGVALTQLNGFGANGYGLYAKFVASGTYTTDGVQTNFYATSNSIELWADANQNTVYGVAGSALPVPSVNNLNLLSGVGTDSDDKLLGSASLTAAAGGSSNTGLANGNFEIIFGDFKLANPDGENYFIAPRPFHMGLDLNGNFQNIVPVSGTSIQLLGNSANAFFGTVVPEPGSLALVGAALLGLGVIGKRRKA